MSLIEKIKETFKQSSERVRPVADKLIEQGKKISEEGLEATREVVAGISEKASDITALTRHKIDINALNKQLQTEYTSLGKVALVLRSQDNPSLEHEEFQKQVDRIKNLKGRIAEKQKAYDAMRMQHSDNYVLNKLSEDLEASNAVLEQVTIAENSSMANKLLKELRLPKEALISAIKREDQLIIPDGNTRMLAGDEVTILGKTDDVAKVVKRITGA